MIDQTTYTVKSKADGLIFIFRYRLNGEFCSFEIVEGSLSEKQRRWLFIEGKFPYLLEQMQQWEIKLKKNFDIIKAEPILDFENLWQQYGNKVKREPAIKAFKKLSNADKIKCFMAVPKYKKYLSLKPHIDQAHLVTWINQKRFDDEY